MSAPAFAWAFERGCVLKLKPADRLVLLYLADMANGERVCWPGQPLIERYTGLKNNTVRAAINRLAALQLIRVEATPGKVTRYHILRPLTPSNGTGDTPSKQHMVTLANGAGAPPQNSTGHPLKKAARPPQKMGLTPSNGDTDPSKTQEEDPRARAYAREGSKILSFGKKQEGAASSPTQPATPGGDDFNSFLEAPTPGKALPCEIEQDVIHADPLDLPVDPEYVRAVVAELKHEFRMRAYPPRSATMSPDDQIAELVTKPRPPTAYLSPEVLRALRPLHHAAAANCWGAT
jgi:hypothetical protein